MTLPAPIVYRSDVEQLKEGEVQTAADINETFDTILETTAENYGHAVRAVHAKAHGLLRAEFEVLGGLSPEYAQGIFQTPKKYNAVLRLSTNAGDILPDAIALPRGLALKVIGVEGERLQGAEGDTQDFIMVNGEAFQAKDAEKFLSSLKLLAKTTDKMEGTKKVLSTVLQGVSSALEAVGLSSSTVQSMGGAPNVDPLGETYFSATPFRYGNYIAKFRIKPTSHDLQELTGRKIDTSDNENAIRDTVRSEMTTISGEWDFDVQLCRDLEKQPVEDATVVWDEADFPFFTVARLRAKPQDSWSDENVQAIDEEMRFSVWTGVEDHRPLGNINRVRKSSYEHSSNFRENFNRCPIHEPRDR
jgi:catalase